MKTKFISAVTMAALMALSVSLSSCKDDDNDDSNPDASTITFENVATVKDFVQSGTFAAIAPGATSSFTFNAAKGQSLMLATMYANSHDLFFAPSNPGIALFESDGTPITGDRSSQIKLWDNGTKMNSDPIAPKASVASPESKNVREVNGTDDQGYTYPAASSMMKINVAYNASTSQFTVTLTNNSNNTTVQTDFSGGVWAVSNVINGSPVNSKPFFGENEVSGTQLTRLAESGDSAPLASMASGLTGIITPISPVLLVVYTGNTNPIFTVGQKDAGLGLSSLAQTGDATQLKASLERERNVVRVYTIGTGNVNPGNKVEGQFVATRGQKIAFVTMFGYSNDWFYANATGIDGLFKGDVTGNIALYDSGTAINQYPGAGNYQHAFGGTSMPESVNISAVGTTTYPVPAVNQMLKVTIR